MTTLSNIEWNKRFGDNCGRVTLDDLRDQIVAQGLLDTFDLKESVDVKTTDVTDTRVEMTLMHLLYGTFQDMGVGRGNPIGFPGKRRPHKWYSRAITRHEMKMAEMYMKRYGHLASLRVMESLPHTIKIG